MDKAILLHADVTDAVMLVLRHEVVAARAVGIGEGDMPKPRRAVAHKLGHTQT